MFGATNVNRRTKENPPDGFTYLFDLLKPEKVFLLEY